MSRSLVLSTAVKTTAGPDQNLTFFSGAAWRMARLSVIIMSLCVAPAAAFTAVTPGIVGSRHLPSHRQCSVWQVSYKHGVRGRQGFEGKQAYPAEMSPTPGSVSLSCTVSLQIAVFDILCLHQRVPAQRLVLRMSGAGPAGSLTLSKNKVAAFLQAQFLPLGLLLAVVAGLLYPAAGAAVGNIPV